MINNEKNTKLAVSDMGFNKDYIKAFINKEKENSLYVFQYFKMD
jgi:hypothetical protein